MDYHGSQIGHLGPFLLQLRSWDLRPLQDSSSSNVQKKEKGSPELLVVRPQIAIPKKSNYPTHLHATAWIFTNLWKFQWIWKNIKRHQQDFWKIPQATIRTFASLASRGGGSPLRRCGSSEFENQGPQKTMLSNEKKPRALAVVCWVCRGWNPKTPVFVRDCGNKPLMWIPKINNSCISKAHLANPPKSPGFHRSAVFRQTEWPLRCLPCASWGARSWTGGDDHRQFFYKTRCTTGFIPDLFAAVQKMYIIWTENEHATVAKRWFC